MIGNHPQNQETIMPESTTPRPYAYITTATGPAA